MKVFVLTLIIASFSTLVHADQTLCSKKKYDRYVDASLTWYQDLVFFTVQENPELEDVGKWFLNGRKNHFELNREAVHHYLRHDPNKITTEHPIETWLNLDQKEIKALASRSGKLGQLAKITFDDRQAKPHNQNYELRAAFAELLSHPKRIKNALDKYNASINTIEQEQCP